MNLRSAGSLRYEVHDDVGWLRAHLHAGGAYPLVSVRVSKYSAGPHGQREYLGPEAADTIQVVRYAMAVAQALAGGGTPPRELEVDAVVHAAAASDAARLELHVAGEVPGIDEARLAAIAEQVLTDSRASAAFTIDAQTQVIASVRAAKSGPGRPAARPDAGPPAQGAAPAEPEGQRLPTDPTASVGRRRYVLAVAGAVVAVGLVAAALTGQIGSLPIGELPNERGVATSGIPSVAAAVGAIVAIATAPATSAPTAVAVEPTATTVVAQPTAIPTAPAPTLRSLLDVSPRPGATLAWPNDPQSTAWLAADGYHLRSRQAGQFVAISALPDQQLRDVVVLATFHKVAGPAGGGYGIIVRDSAPGLRDGRRQDGQYYVVEVGDRGEVGIWRRDEDHWAELLGWRAHPAVAPGVGENTVTLRAVGGQLTLSVNGADLAIASDAALAHGGVGVFLGGDSNEAVLTRLSVQALE